MKHILVTLILLTQFICFSQKQDREKEMRETISWINNKLRDKGVDQNFLFQEIVYVKGEPILYLVQSPGICSDKCDIVQIPIKKIKHIRFAEATNHLLYFETKNSEEIIWYQSEDKSCGQIGDYTFIELWGSIEQNNLILRLQNAFSYLMELYDNDGVEKF
ncbi:hypothetical protein [Flavobacterium chungnamense]|uniref:YbjN domain-containing protein n=1 Tax=Flavobacterium chungnamense TaxID=706182 RepID=A0ABP7V5M1_9FLAO